MQEGQKLKLLYLAKIFQEETDEKHGITMPQIIERLSEYGISAERKSLYRDINLLRDFGFDIQKYHRAPVEYGLNRHMFSHTELMLLADAVQSSRFLTKSKSDALLKSIKGLGSKEQAKTLSKRLHVEGRIKTQNESVFHNVDLIQEAIRTRKRLVFRYYKYDLNKVPKLQRDGKDYTENPVQLLYSDGFYYLICYNDAHSDFATYRVDRMTAIRISDERATKNEAIATFDVADYESRVFGMFSGRRVTATLLVKESAMNGVIDRFGKDVEVLSAPEEGWARVVAPIFVSPVFFGWISEFSGDVLISQPRALVDEYTAYLQNILDAHRKQTV